MKRIIPLIVLLTLVGGCLKGADTEISTSTPFTSLISNHTIAFKTISKGTYTGYTKKANLLVNDDDEWARLLQRLTANGAHGLKVQYVDFSINSVIAVFMGQKSSGGHEIFIEKIELDGNARVYLVEKYPPAGGIVTDALTQPYHIIIVEKLDDVEFIEEIIGGNSRIQKIECTVNKDCLVTGCSGTICSPEGLISTCKWSPEHDCYELARCSCISGGCQWVMGEEFEDCIEERTPKPF